MPTHGLRESSQPDPIALRPTDLAKTASETTHEVYSAFAAQTSKFSIAGSATARLATTPTTSRARGRPAPGKTIAALARRRLSRDRRRFRRSVSPQTAGGISTKRSISASGDPGLAPRWRHQPKAPYRPVTCVPSRESIHTSADQRSASWGTPHMLG